MTMLEVRSSDVIDGFPRNRLGIPEPLQDGSRMAFEEIAHDDTDLVIVPSVAFGLNRERLGHGGGYYDRYLNSLNNLRAERGGQPIKTLGICLACQSTNQDIPLEPHDVKIDSVVVGSEDFVNNS